jgi:hypothetical protein
MPLLGINAKVYWLDDVRASWGTLNTDTGSVEGPAPVLVEFTQVKDVKYNMEKGTADVTNRGNGGWTATATVLKDASVDLTATYNPADDTDGIMAALIGAALNNTTIPIAILDGDAATVGTQGLWSDFQVTKYDKDEPLIAGQLITFNLKTGNTSVAPEWVTVTL